MGNKVVFLFGEAERGAFCTPLRIESLAELADRCGNPPEGSLGIAYGVQALLFERELFFYRVKEEGFSLSDYMRGMRALEDGKVVQELAAICLPGVGNQEIIEAAGNVCLQRGSFLIASEKDLYDYLTDRPFL